ncbi:995_t:CDS:2 [Rhizophagus irregularis]|nr:995_t:CDS:2 [Rhizophagus irregularis]
MVNYKDIKLALVEIIKVTYSQGTKKYDKMGLSYVGYLKTMQRKRDPDDHCRYIAKQRSPNEEVYNERMADFKDCKYLTKTSWDNLGSSNPIGPSRGLEALERYVLFFELQQEKYPKVKLQNCQALQEKLEGFLPKLDSAQ